MKYLRKTPGDVPEHRDKRFSGARSMSTNAKKGEKLAREWDTRRPVLGIWERGFRMERRSCILRLSTIRSRVTLDVESSRDCRIGPHWKGIKFSLVLYTTETVTRTGCARVCRGKIQNRFEDLCKSRLHLSQKD